MVKIQILARTLAPLAALLLYGSCAATSASSCPSFSGSGSWVVEMQADDSDYNVSGSIIFDPDGRTELTATTGDGAREPLRYPLETVTVESDSVHITFAPIGYSLRGRCVAPDSIAGRFSVPQPPFEDVEGTWKMTRQP
jgi:hypothetical protein